MHCEIEDFRKMLRSTVSDPDFPLEVFDRCGYVETTSHKRVEEYLKDYLKSPQLKGRKPLVIVYGEPGIGKSFLARTLQFKLLSEARQLIEKEMRGECAELTILPVYVNLLRYVPGKIPDEGKLVEIITESIEDETLNTLYSEVYSKLTNLRTFQQLAEFFDSVRKNMRARVSIPAFFSFLRLLKFRYFIILDEVSSMVESVNVDALRRILLEMLMRRLAESLGDSLAGVMLILHAETPRAVEAIGSSIGELENVSVPAYGSTERFDIFSIGQMNFMPSSDEAVYNWLRNAGIKNELVAGIYRDIVTKYKFRFGSNFLEAYINYVTGAVPSEDSTTILSAFHKEMSRELNKKIAEKLRTRLRKPVKEEEWIGKARFEIVVDNYIIDVKVLSDLKKLEKDARDDLVKAGNEINKYKLIYALITEREGQISLKDIIPNSEVIQIVIPQLDLIYQAVRDAEKISGESEKTPIIGPLALRQKVNFKALLLDRIAETVAAQLESRVFTSLKTRSYDTLTYRLVEEDCRKLNGKSGTEWMKHSLSLNKALGGKPKNIEDVKRGVEEVNRRIAGSGKRLVIISSKRGRREETHIYCQEEKP